jgi:uncharacterized metal-binding protein YceD (DUF177 family)
MAAETLPKSEFSRPVPLQDLGETEFSRDIEATAAERAALAERLGLLSLDRLTAESRLRREGGGLVRVEGSFQASLTQACVVTLEPVASDLAGSFSLLYSEDPDAAASAGEVLVELDQEDPPDPVPPGGIDLGEAVAEQLALALDPYPRVEGAEFQRSGGGDDRSGPESGNSPFAVLESLKGRK